MKQIIPKTIRLQILEFVATKNNTPKSFTQIKKRLGKSNTVIARELKFLKEKGILKQCEEGYYLDMDNPYVDDIVEKLAFFFHTISDLDAYTIQRMFTQNPEPPFQFQIKINLVCEKIDGLSGSDFEDIFTHDVRMWLIGFVQAIVSVTTNKIIENKKIPTDEGHVLELLKRPHKLLISYKPQ